MANKFEFRTKLLVEFVFHLLSQVIIDSVVFFEI